MGNRRDRVTLSGPADVNLRSSSVQTLALAMHELLTNAIKYGALSSDSGSVSVSWQILGADEQKRLYLEWNEQGGPPVSSPERRGFGSRMIERGLSAELGGKVAMDFRPGGLVCTIDAPLPSSPSEASS